MNRKPTLVLLAAALVAPAALTACEKEGPAENAGRKIDKATEKAGDSMKQAGDKLKDTTK